ncbi:MAG: DivIVA domain-containing protein [Propionibacteriaceae bacterium]|jgi:DivIVA domain-containing protein|nr:DivIVA domain-containing protein [Propionibacteriaceae bacterium]
MLEYVLWALVVVVIALGVWVALGHFGALPKRVVDQPRFDIPQQLDSRSLSQIHFKTVSRGYSKTQVDEVLQRIGAQLDGSVVPSQPGGDYRTALERVGAELSDATGSVSLPKRALISDEPTPAPPSAPMPVAEPTRNPFDDEPLPVFGAGGEEGPEPKLPEPPALPGVLSPAPDQVRGRDQVGERDEETSEAAEPETVDDEFEPRLPDPPKLPGQGADEPRLPDPPTLPQAH